MARPSRSWLRQRHLGSYVVQILFCLLLNRCKGTVSGEMATREWAHLWARLQRRAIRVIDIATILVCDALINGFGYLIAQVVASNKPDNRFLAAASKLSEGAFLLLYVTWVGVDLYEYVRTEIRSTRIAEMKRAGAGL